MLVGVTPRPFWYVSWGEPVVVLFRVPVLSSSVVRVGWLVGGIFFFRSLAALAKNFIPGYLSSFFLYANPWWSVVPWNKRI